MAKEGIELFKHDGQIPYVQKELYVYSNVGVLHKFFMLACNSL